MNREQVEEFLKRLEGPEGCNFRERVQGDPESTIWDCGYEQELSRKILTRMNIPKVEQDEFLEECRELGGYCDCEIIFNAGERLLGRREDTQPVTQG